MARGQKWLLPLRLLLREWALKWNKKNLKFLRKEILETKFGKIRQINWKCQPN